MTGEMWVIESGDYSYYQVRAICATEEEARAACERANRMLEGSHEDRWECSPRPIIEAEDVSLLHWAQARADGTHISGYTRVGFRQDEGVVAWDSSGAWVTTEASTPERAAKIAQDRQAQLKAEAMLP